MKYLAHVPTESYGFISVEVEGYAEDAVVAYKGIQEAWKGGEGIGLKALAKVLHEYCTTGAIVDGGNYDFSDKEKLLIGEIKKLLRNNKK